MTQEVTVTYLTLLLAGKLNLPDFTIWLSSEPYPALLLGSDSPLPEFTSRYYLYYLRILFGLLVGLPLNIIRLAPNTGSAYLLLLFARLNGLPEFTSCLWPSQPAAQAKSLPRVTGV